MLGAAAAVQLWFVRRQWFYGDEWDALLLRALHGRARYNLLDPHNEHWSTIPIVVYRLVFALFGLRSYVPIAVVFVSVNLVAAYLLRVICVRGGADPLIATATCCLFVLFGPARDDLLFAWNMTFTGALACCFGVLVLLTREHNGEPMTRRAVGLTAALTALSLLFSGVALTGLVVIAVIAWRTGGWRIATVIVAPAVIAYGIWDAHWGRRGLGAQPLFTSSGLRHVPSTVVRGLTFGFDSLIGLRFSGALLVTALVVWWLAGLAGKAQRLLPAGCALGAAAYFGLIALRRNSVLLPPPETGRYLLVGFAFVVPALACALSAVAARLPAGRLAVLLLVAVLIGRQLATIHSTEHRTAAARSEERQRAFASVLLAEHGAPLVSQVALPESAFEESVTVQRLVELQRDHKLPSRLHVSAQGMLDARADLQVGLATTSDAARTPSPGPAVSATELELRPTPAGCRAFVADGPAPVVRIRFSTPSYAVVRVKTPMFFRFWLEQDGRRSRTRLIVLFAGGPYILRVTAPDATVAFRPPTGAEVC